MAINKWRPSHKCLYVVSEIHGQVYNFKNVIKRIFPLRKFEGQEDICVFMGDYIDGTEFVPETLDLLIDIKAKYPDRTFFLKGNHEDMFIKAFHSQQDYLYWIDNGGYSTLLGYLKIQEKPYENPRGIPYQRLFDIVPKEHLDFVLSLQTNVHYEDFFFFHGGFDFNKPVLETNDSVFLYDHTSSRLFKDICKKKLNVNFANDFVYVGSHNYNSEEPFIHQNYIMLGENKGERIFVLDLYSMEISAIRKDKDKLYPYEYSYFE